MSGAAAGSIRILPAVPSRDQPWVRWCVFVVDADGEQHPLYPTYPAGSIEEARATAERLSTSLGLPVEATRPAGLQIADAPEAAVRQPIACSIFVAPIHSDSRYPDLHWIVAVVGPDGRQDESVLAQSAATIEQARYIAAQLSQRLGYPIDEHPPIGPRLVAANDRAGSSGPTGGPRSARAPIKPKIRSPHPASR